MSSKEVAKEVGNLGMHDQLPPETADFSNSTEDKNLSGGSFASLIHCVVLIYISVALVYVSIREVTPA